MPSAKARQRRLGLARMVTAGRRRVAVAQVADLFCGGGGTSAGLTRAYARLGLPFHLMGINHWETALATFRFNNPDAVALPYKLEEIPNPRALVAGGHLSLLIASPECTHHSRAGGGRPRDDQSRSTMSQVHHWAVHTRPRLLFVENVPEALDWGPLNEEGYPIRELRGTYYRAWFRFLQDIGYQNLEARVVRAADYGDPTTRERLIVCGSLDGAPLRWPDPSHGGVDSGRAPYRTFRECVQWDLEGLTVGTKRRQGYFRTRAERLACIEAGIDKFGGEPFVLRRNQRGNSPWSNAKSIDAPLFTVTAGSTDIALIVPRGRDVDRARHRMCVPRELARAQGFPEAYRFAGSNAEQVAQIGNAVPTNLAEAHLRALLDPDRAAA